METGVEDSPTAKNLEKPLVFVLICLCMLSVFYVIFQIKKIDVYCMNFCIEAKV